MLVYRVFFIWSYWLNIVYVFVISFWVFLYDYYYYYYYFIFLFFSGFDYVVCICIFHLWYWSIIEFPWVPRCTQGRENHLHSCSTCWRWQLSLHVWGLPRASVMLAIHSQWKSNIEQIYWSQFQLRCAWVIGHANTPSLPLYSECN